jgi:hypothetical protein
MLNFLNGNGLNIYFHKFHTCFCVIKVYLNMCYSKPSIIKSTQPRLLYFATKDRFSFLKAASSGSACMWLCYYH